MVDPVAIEFFREQQKDVANTGCCDNSGAKAEWASVQHGIYISISASGVHRSLGVKTSRVLSTTMDSWQPLQLRMMQLGGNQRFKDFLQEHGIPEDMPIRQKYNTRAAEWYRKNLLAEAEDTELPKPLPLGTGHLPADSGMNCNTNQILDAVFASASPTSGNVSGPRKRSKVKCRSTTDGVIHAASVNDGCDSKNLSASAFGLRKIARGHHTAQRLKSMSSGTMEGFGDSGLCHAAKKCCVDAGRKYCVESGLGIVASVAAAFA